MENKEKEKLIEKPPVVVILGHVDSGKTSILDFIRKTRVAEKEAGGITQHIGAYQIEYQKKRITFIDTPGHEAFSAMRARGARVADIAVLVIDLVQGIQPQTKEAISKIKLSGIPFVVALNKIDLKTADPQKVIRELQKEGIVVEKLGGKVPTIETSAKSGQGIDELLDIILLLAEMENLKADISVPAKGFIIESTLDRRRGPVATLIVEEGILKEGDIVATFSAYGKIKRMEDFQGLVIKEAFPSTPLLIIGFQECPKIGEEFQVFPDLQSAQQFLKKSSEKEKEIISVGENQKAINLILKADCLGSLEAIENILRNLPQEKFSLRILKSEIGDIDESDLKLAKTGKALILGFRVKIDPVAQKIIEREELKILTFEIIYDLVEKIRKLMEKYFEPEIVRQDLAKMKVLVDFWSEKNRQIVGGKILEGEIKRGAFVEVFRNEELVGKGKILNLQINKKDIDKAKKGQECGILYEGEGKIAVGDILKIYFLEKKKTEF